MTPESKAKELVENFVSALWKNGNPNSVYQHAKECAITAINIILANKSSMWEFVGSSIPDYRIMCSGAYWLEVKQEISKL